MNLRKTYRREVKAGLAHAGTQTPELLTESDLAHLPPVVVKYLQVAGVVGREKVYNMRVVLKGRIRSNPEDSWMKITSEQYNFYNENPTRAFYLRASKAGIPVFGLHLYKNVKAFFVIKLLDLFRIIDARGDKMNQGETVTLFNDMCLMAPATLISENIQWDILDALTVRAHFTNGNITIAATLFFNEKGEIINFISNDRYETDGKKYNNYPWLTPVKSYGDFNGLHLSALVSTDTQRPDVTFSYGEFEMTKVEYNCKILK